MLTPDQNAPHSGELFDSGHFQRAVAAYAGETGRVFDPELLAVGPRTAPLSEATLDALETWAADRAARLQRRASADGDVHALQEAQENLTAVRRFRRQAAR